MLTDRDDNRMYSGIVNTIPGIGALKSGYEFGTGRDAFTGEEISPTQAAIGLVTSVAFVPELRGGSSLASVARAETSVASRSFASISRLETRMASTEINFAAKTLPGPSLPSRIADTFAGSVYVNRQLAADTSFFKYHGVNNRTGRKFSWVTDQKYASEAALRSSLAIRDDWGINITHVTEFSVPKNTWISEGLAGPQGVGYPGGGYQGVIENLPRSWIIRTDKAF